MYPFKVYISKPGERYKIYPVWVRGYTQGISADSFKRRMLRAGSKASKSLKTLQVYSYLPIFEYDHQVDMYMECHREVCEEAVPKRPFKPLYDIQEKEYELFDFYDEIGYDKSTGKINGLTLNQHIRKYLKEKDNAEVSE